MAGKRTNQQNFTEAVEEAVETQPSLSMEKKLFSKFGHKDEGPGNGHDASGGRTQMMEAPEDWPSEVGFENPRGAESPSWSAQTGEVQQRSFGGGEEQGQGGMPQNSGRPSGDLQDAWRQMQRGPRPEGRSQARPRKPLGPTEETIRNTGHGGSGSRLEQQQRDSGGELRQPGGFAAATSGASEYQGSGAVTGSSFVPGAPGRPEASGSWRPPTQDRGTQISTEAIPGGSPVSRATFGQSAGRRSGTGDP
ncbi:MAG: hypothetical protein ACRDIA_05645, partial [Actinomycetota bacterium]